MEFFDTEIAPAIKPTSKNKGKNIDSKYQLNGWDLRYFSVFRVCFVYHNYATVRAPP